MLAQRKISVRILAIVLCLFVSGCSSKAIIESGFQPSVDSVVDATEEATPTAAVMEFANKERYSQSSVDICPMMKQQAAEVFGTEFTLENNAPFTDIVSGETGEACRMTSNINADKYQNVSEIIQVLIESLGLGWTEQINYQADGPNASSTAMTRDWTIMIFSVGNKLSEIVDCSSDQPATECVELGDPQDYLIQIEIAEYHPEFTLDGHWVDNSTGFVLDLYQNWKAVYGQHLIVAQNGNKIDSMEASINGQLEGRTVSVDFQSSFSKTAGQAEITYQDDGSILWKIITPPDGEYYLPEEAVLTRNALQ